MSMVLFIWLATIMGEPLEPRDCYLYPLQSRHFLDPNRVQVFIFDILHYELRHQRRYFSIAENHKGRVAEAGHRERQ
jgi:hypothetical protein